MKATSMAPLSMASVSAGPALKVLEASSLSGAKSLAKIPSWTPTRAGAWVMLGKYPSRRVTGAELEPADAEPQAPATSSRQALIATHPVRERFHPFPVFPTGVVN